MRLFRPKIMLLNNEANTLFIKDEHPDDSNIPRDFTHVNIVKQWSYYDEEEMYERSNFLLTSHEKGDEIRQNLQTSVGSELYVRYNLHDFYGVLYEVVVQGNNPETALAFVQRWINDIKSFGSGFFTGDDAYYDYAPSEIEMICTVCNYFELQWEYEEFYKWVNTNYYSNDDTLIIPYNEMKHLRMRKA